MDPIEHVDFPLLCYMLVYQRVSQIAPPNLIFQNPAVNHCEVRILEPFFHKNLKDVFGAQFNVS